MWRRLGCRSPESPAEAQAPRHQAEGKEEVRGDALNQAVPGVHNPWVRVFL